MTTPAGKLLKNTGAFTTCQLLMPAIYCAVHGAWLWNRELLYAAFLNRDVCLSAALVLFQALSAWFLLQTVKTLGSLLTERLL